MVQISLVPALTPLYLYVNSFRSVCAVPNMAVFCSSLTSWFLGTLLTYFLNDFEMVPVAPIITGITFVTTITFSLSANSKTNKNYKNTSYLHAVSFNGHFINSPIIFSFCAQSPVLTFDILYREVTPSKNLWHICTYRY
jgi:hypothetical protein